ncbi:MAG TPA: WD40 repeat domain-containing protein, partial [Pirellulales bacterium]|nr:WD40 repeat domain-containing protein [Pirellulales bacterium]
MAPVVDPDDPMSTEMSAEETARVEEIEEEVRRLWQKSPQTPLPADAKALSANERLRQYNEWLESLYVDAWRTHGKHDPRWDDQAIALIHDFVKPNSSPLSQREITIRARQLLAKGCDDILMRHVVARSFDLSAGHACYKAINLMRPKLETLGPDYPAPVAYKIELRYVAAWNRGYRNKPGPLAPTVERMIDRVVKSISGPLTDEERRRHMHRLSVDMAGALGRYDELLFKKLAATPDADRWLVQLLLAAAHVQRGWQARGGGWAGEVTAKGWESFAAHMAKARSLRLQAWKEHPDLPEAALGMITVTMAGAAAGEDCRFWLDRAVEADFDMAAAYQALLYSMRPRWGGSHEAMLAFGRECLATRRFDVGVPWNFHAALADVLSEVDDPRQVCTASDVYDDYLTLLDGSRALAKDDAERHILDTSRACIAWLTSHDDEARRLLEKLGDDVVADVFAGLHTTLSDLRLSLSGGKRAPPGERWPDCGVEQLRFAAEASRLVSFGTRAGLKAWDMANGGQLAFELPMKVEGRSMRDVDISPDGSLLAMILFDEANEMKTGSVVLWDAETRKVRSTLPPPSGRPAYRLRFSPDGKRLAAGMLDGSLTIWDVETGKRPEWAHWPAHASWVQTLAFTADGRRLAT